MPYNEEPRIITNFKQKHCTNPISGHSWTEYTYKGALKELDLRKQILRERALRGEIPTEK